MNPSLRCPPCHPCLPAKSLPRLVGLTYPHNLLVWSVHLFRFSSSTPLNAPCFARVSLALTVDRVFHAHPPRGVYSTRSLLIDYAAFPLYPYIPVQRLNRG